MMSTCALLRHAHVLVSAAIIAGWLPVQASGQAVPGRPEDRATISDTIRRVGAAASPIWGTRLMPDAILLLRKRYVTCAVVEALGSVPSGEFHPFGTSLVGILGVLKSPESIDALTRLAERDPSVLDPLVGRWYENTGYYLHHECEWESVREPWAQFFITQAESQSGDGARTLAFCELMGGCFYDARTLAFFRTLSSKSNDVSPELTVVVEWALRTRGEAPRTDALADAVERLARRDIRSACSLALRYPMPEWVGAFAVEAESDPYVDRVLRGIAFVRPTQGWRKWWSGVDSRDRSEWLATRIADVRRALAEREFETARVFLGDCLPGDPVVTPVLSELAAVPELQSDIIGLLMPSLNPRIAPAIRATVAELQRSGLTKENERVLRERLLLPMSWDDAIQVLATRSVPIQ